jgi:hypothetical protein
MEHRDKDFVDQDVHLDNNTFTGCTFRNCRLIYSGEGAVELSVCNFDEESQWLLGGAAVRTLDYLTMLYHTPGKTGRKLIEEMFEKIRRGR